MAAKQQDLILAIAPDPEVTARRWANLSPEAPTCLDETFLFHCYSHHVNGIVWDAMRILGWDAMLPPFLFTVMSRAGGLSEQVWDTHYAALRELAGHAPDLVRQSLIVKGAIIGLMYPRKHHRVMSDFDLIVPADLLPQMLTALQVLGYERRSEMAYDMVKDVGPLYTGAGQVAMHVWELPKGWERHIHPGAVLDVQCLVPTTELHLVELLLNSHEHAASWYYALWESDLQLVRFLDVNLLTEAAGGVDPLSFWRTAVDVGLHTEVALGLWTHEQLGGNLPAGWSRLRPVLDAVAPFGDLFAMPESVDVDDRVRRWPLTVRERVFHPSRHQLALDQLPAHQRTVEFVKAIKDGQVSRRQPVHDIVDQARTALASTAVPGETTE
jgi:hypothetical protein